MNVLLITMMRIQSIVSTACLFSGATLFARHASFYVTPEGLAFSILRSEEWGGTGITVDIFTA